VNKHVEKVDLYFQSGNSVPVKRASIPVEDWDAVLSYIEYLEKRVSDYGWEASARYAAMTGGTL